MQQIDKVLWAWEPKELDATLHACPLQIIKPSKQHYNGPSCDPYLSKGDLFLTVDVVQGNCAGHSLVF